MQQEGGEAITTWMLTGVEVISALCRRRREGAPPEVFQAAAGRLEVLERAWVEVHDARQVRQRAKRLLEVHPLRAADALQLAAALVASREQPVGVGFITLDEVLAEAAAREGFAVSGSGA